MSKKVRIELRFDEIEDKDMIDFIDKYGSTRAGFIKQILKMYKNNIENLETSTPDVVEPVTTNKDIPKNKVKKKLSTKNDISFSSNDF